MQDKSLQSSKDIAYMLDPLSVFGESEHEKYLMQMHNEVVKKGLNLKDREI